MKIKSLVFAGVLCLATPLLVLGCSTDRADQTEMGQLHMPLTSTSGSGTNYRLSSAVFDITGPTAGQIVSDDYVGQPVAIVDLSEGEYEVQLQAGWQLEREESGAFVPVEAALKSAPIAPFAITEGESSQVQFVFATAGDDVVFGAGQLELSVAVEEVPGQWTCELGYYDAVDGCDCNCGVPDPDCEIEGQPVFGCGPGGTCSAQGLCENESVCGNGIVETGETCDDGNNVAGDGCADCQVEGPAGWTCNGVHYNAADGCDCACGIPDPDCEIEGAPVYGCNEGDTCSAEGLCENNSVCGNGIVEPGEQCDDGNNVAGDGCADCAVEGPAGWTCNGAYYNAADGCDCACGIPDPDCDLPDQDLYNCEDGQVCSTEGLCVLP